jgi:hypothetical protein
VRTDRGGSRKIYDFEPKQQHQRKSCIRANRVLAYRLAGGPGIQTPWPTDDPGLTREGRRELRTLLAKRGYDVGAPDGAIGANGLESAPLKAASRTKGERKGCR